MKQNYDVIIIGGEHNGLVNAAYLAKAGKKVLVLERRHVLGGAAVTEEWSGGVPSAASGASNTWTVTTINIVRIAGSGTPNTDYLVLCQATNYE